MELILYYLSESRNLLITFLILMFIIGIIAYLFLRKFRQDKKMKVFFYGLFLRMNNIDIFKLGIVVVKTFLAFYATIITNEMMMWLCLIMIIMSTVIYIVLAYKRMVYEIVCTIMQVVMIYFIYIINDYMIEIEDTSLMLMIKICFTVFVLILTTYLFFRDVDIIAQDRVDKNFKKERKRFRERNELINGTITKKK